MDWRKFEPDCCSVVNEDCLSPANLDPRRHVKTQCFRCGLPVCRECSKVVVYFRFGRKRICNICRDDMKRHAAQPETPATS